MLKRFTKNELTVVTLIFVVIIFASYINLKASIVRARDAQRRADLKAVANALEKYNSEFGFFPPSSDDGKILACRGPNFEAVIEEIKEEFDLNKYFQGLRECSWGQDKFGDLSGLETIYLEKLPNDPNSNQGSTFLYLSNTKRYQIYGHLEGGKNEEGYDEEIIKRGLSCGNQVCNYGLAFGSTPLNISIDEYENQLN